MSIDTSIPIKINLNWKQACEDFDESNMELTAIDVIETNHDEMLELINNSFNSSNLKEIKRAYHTIKSTSRYFYETGFADLCQKMENLAKEQKLDELLLYKEYSIKYFNAFYLSVLEIYKKLKNDSGEVVRKEYLNKIKSDFTFYSESNEEETEHVNEVNEDKDKEDEEEGKKRKEISFLKLVQINEDKEVKEGIENKSESDDESKDDDSENNDKIDMNIEINNNKKIENSKTRLSNKKRHSIFETVKKDLFFEEDDFKKENSNKSLSLSTKKDSITRTTSQIEYLSLLKEQLTSKLKINSSFFALKTEIISLNNKNNNKFDFKITKYINKSQHSYKSDIKEAFRLQSTLKLIEVLANFSVEVRSLTLEDLSNQIEEIIRIITLIGKEIFPEDFTEALFLEIVDTVELQCKNYSTNNKKKVNENGLKISNINKTLIGPKTINNQAIIDVISSPSTKKKKTIDDFYNSFRGFDLDCLYSDQYLKSDWLFDEFQRLKIKNTEDIKGIDKLNKRRMSVHSKLMIDNSDEVFPFKQEKLGCFIY